MVVRVYSNDGTEILKVVSGAEIKYSPLENLLVVVKGEALLFTGSAKDFHAISSSK